MFKATVSTREDGVLVTSEATQTARAAIDKAAREAETSDDQRVRIGVSESDGTGDYREVFWAWGDGVAHAAREARAMDAKSRRGNGR